MKRIKLFILMMAFVGMANATVYYVSSTGSNTTGDSWATAFTSPAAAIASATPVSGSEFWVKQGTYISATTLSWETGQNFYGGFVGTETLRSQRSTDASLTILEGNNTNRVLNAPSMASATTWDGFTIQKGTAATGAGAFLQKNAILSNCIFQNNTAANATTPFVAAGGGIYIQGLAADADSIKVLNCIVKNNIVKTIITTSVPSYSYCGGGGIYIKAGSIKAVVRGCTIESNTADGLGTANAIVSGGGIYMLDGTIDGSTIKNNVATNVNPTTFVVTNAKNQGGGIFIMPQASTSTLVKNSTISGNSSPTYVGGGIAIDPLYTSTVVTGKVAISNCFILNNSTRGAGGGAITAAGNVASTSEYSFTNCVITNNESSTVAAGGGGVFVNNLLGTNVLPTVNNSVKFINCTVANNKMLTTNYGGAGIFYNNISADISNCVFWGNASVGALAPYNVRVKNTLTTNKLINCAFDSRFVELEVSPVATPANLTGKVIVELSNTGSTVGKYYANFTSPTNFIGKAVTAGDITSLAAANWAITSTSGCFNAGATSTATSDIVNLSRPQGSAYDIGAYEVPYYNTTITFNANGAVDSYSTGAVVNEAKGTQLAFTITANSLYQITSVLYNGVEVKGDMVGNVYTAAALSANATLVVQFDLIPVYYNTTVTFNANGTVNSYTSGDIDSKLQGTQLAFTITANSLYQITSVLYNGVEVKGDMIGDVYTAAALSANATLVVQFDLIPVYYNTTITFNAKGTVNSYTSGDVDSKLQGTQLAFTIVANTGYRITSVLYNDVEVKGDLVENVYTAPALSANATLVVQFDLITGLDKFVVDFQCFSAEKSVELSGLTAGQVVLVYNIASAKIIAKTVNSSSASFSLPRGIYMVKVANSVKKVIVK